MKPDIWEWSETEYRVHCQTRKQYETILEWTGSRHGSTYTMLDSPKEYDVTIPAKLVKRVRRLLGLDQKKRKKPAVVSQ
jgi:hypothetical protein